MAMCCNKEVNMHATIILIWLAVVFMRAINAHDTRYTSADTKPMGEPVPTPTPPPWGIGA